MDISSSTAPRSDQQNFDDYIAGPRTVTVAEVKQGTAEQPVEVHLVEYPGRPYKPSKSMRRVLVAAWGAEASAYAGRKIQLYGDPEVTFGRDKVGGIKIAALSHIDKQLSISLTVTRGRRAPYIVQPITAVDLALSAIANATTLIKLAEIEARAKELGIHTNTALAATLDIKRAELGGTAN